MHLVSLITSIRFLKKRQKLHTWQINAYVVIFVNKIMCHSKITIHGLYNRNKIFFLHKCNFQNDDNVFLQIFTMQGHQGIAQKHSTCHKNA